MVERPKNPFTLAADPHRKEPEKIRDKDNVQQRPPPPSWSRQQAPNMAPTGNMGIKRGLPSPKAHKPDKHSFVKGDLGKKFKSIAPNTKEKTIDHDR